MPRIGWGGTLASMVMTASATEPRMTPYGSPYVRPQGLKRRFRAQVRNGVRVYGKMTARWRVTPDYLIIGTKRGGTTSMARWLLEHPDVRPLFPARETRKGTYYFDVNYGRGEAWYRSHFPTRRAMNHAARRAGRKQLVGEATPYYLHHPHAAIRARRLAPEAKVIVLLRDPAERAYSHWVERTRNNIETLAFAGAVEAEAVRLDGEEARMLSDPTYNSFAHQHFSYLDQGRYARGYAAGSMPSPPISCSFSAVRTCTPTRGRSMPKCSTSSRSRRIRRPSSMRGT